MLFGLDSLMSYRGTRKRFWQTVNVPGPAVSARYPCAGISIGEVTAGYGHTCAVASNGSLWCWGMNGNGQLGVGTSVSEDNPLRVQGVHSRGCGWG